MFKNINVSSSNYAADLAIKLLFAKLYPDQEAALDSEVAKMLQKALETIRIRLAKGGECPFIHRNYQKHTEAAYQEWRLAYEKWAMLGVQKRIEFAEGQSFLYCRIQAAWLALVKDEITAPDSRFPDLPDHALEKRRNFFVRKLINRIVDESDRKRLLQYLRTIETNMVKGGDIHGSLDSAKYTPETYAVWERASSQWCSITDEERGSPKEVDAYYALQAALLHVKAEDLGIQLAEEPEPLVLKRFQKKTVASGTLSPRQQAAAVKISALKIAAKQQTLKPLPLDPLRKDFVVSEVIGRMLRGNQGRGIIAKLEIEDEMARGEWPPSWYGREVHRLSRAYKKWAVIDPIWSRQSKEERIKNSRNETLLYFDAVAAWLDVMIIRKKLNTPKGRNSSVGKYAEKYAALTGQAQPSAGSASTDNPGGKKL